MMKSDERRGRARLGTVSGSAVGPSSGDVEHDLVRAERVEVDRRERQQPQPAFGEADSESEPCARWLHPCGAWINKRGRFGDASFCTDGPWFDTARYAGKISGA
jgi:hypothetical protein